MNPATPPSPAGDAPSSSCKVTSGIAFKTGAIIAAAHPLTHVLEWRFKGQRCDNCYTKSSELKHCASCKTYHYCNRTCQKEDWKAGHKFECPFYAKMEKSVPKMMAEAMFSTGKVVGLLLRTYLLVRNKPEVMDKKYDLYTGSQRSLADLMDDDAGGMFDLMFRSSFRAFCTIDEDFAANADKRLLKSLFHKIQINSFAIDHLNEKGSIGVALYIDASIFNHSCRSNAAWVFKGTKMEVRAMRDIRVGEEVTVHYFGQLIPKAERQVKLMIGFNFECRCDRCEAGDLPGEIEELARDKRYHDSLTIARMSRLTDDQQADHIFYGMLEVLDIEEKYNGPFEPYMTHDLYLAVERMAFKSKQTANDKRKLKTMIEKLTKAVAVTHGDDHPVISMSHLNMMRQMAYLNI